MSRSDRVASVTLVAGLLGSLSATAVPSRAGPAFPPPGVTVTPDGSSTPPRPAFTNGYSATFTVKNTQSSTQTFCLSRESSANITTTSQSYSSVTLAPSESINVNVSYNVGAPGTGYVRLWAECGFAFDSGTWNVPVVPPVTVTPDGQTAAARITQTGGYTDTFTVTNTGVALYTYTLTCGGTANVSCTGVSPREVSLDAGGQATVVAAYNVGSAGTGTLRLVAATGSLADTGSYSVPVNNPTAGAPLVDASPMYGHWSQRMDRCAASCFDATYAQSTVPYFSLDAPRNVTLAYHGDRVDPKPFVHVNVRPDSTYGQWPSEYRFQVKVNGAFVTFLNGEGQAGQPLRFAYPGNVWARLGGQFDATSYATGVYPMEIIVAAYYASSEAVITNSWTTKLIVVKENDSPIARGWTLAGIQRVYSYADGALVTEGDGSAVYFPKSGAVYVTPAGEFSELRSVGSAWTRAYPDSTKVTFNTLGRMIEVRDRWNNVTTVIYDASNRVSQIKDPLNLAITLTYDGNGLDAITDPASRVTQVAVDASKRLTLIQDPDNVGTSFGYDGSLRLSTITNRRGDTTTLGYDAQSGKLATVTAPSITYVGTNGADSTGSPVSAFAAWHKVGVPYGATGTPVAAPRADTVYGRVTDPGGHLARFTVNRWGAPAVATDPLGRTDSTWFDANGLPIRARSATGAVDTAAYNASGLPTYVRTAAADSGRYVRYAAWAQPDSVWGFEQPPVRHFIGANGRVDSTRTHSSTGPRKTRFTYEARGRLETVTDPEGHLAGRTWYAGTNGNRSRDSLPGGRVMTYSYDTYGRPTSVTAPGVATRITGYDILNRVLKDSTAGMPPVLYAYDSLFLKKVTDPKGQEYSFAYNPLGWVTARIDPVGKADSMWYDRDGLVRRSKNRRGEAITVSYDIGHRPSSKSGTDTGTVTWTYAADDRTTAATSPWATDSLFFSVAGVLDSVRTKLGGQTFAQRFRYTAGGLVDSVEIAGGGIAFRARKYLWDEKSGAIDSIRLGGGVGTVLGTNLDGQVTGTTLPGGDLVSAAYTAVHHQAQRTTTASYATSVNRYLNFDLAGRITREIYGTGTSGHAYSYDNLGRLITDAEVRYDEPSNPCEPPMVIDENGNQCTYEGTWTTIATQTFSYDSVGNRRDQGGDYGPGNRIRSFASCTYVTDSLGDGNVLQRTCGSEVIQFHWSAESRLKALKVVGGDSLNFRYDAAGRLVRRDVNGTAQSYFLWQGDNLLAELNGSATGKVAEYSYYPGLDKPHAVIVGTTAYYAHRDGRGNVIALTDSAQNAQRTYLHDAWGVQTSGADNKPFSGADRARFKGALWLGPQAELYYMRARWYDPTTGRFLSEDPIGLEGGINPYVYASNDPINRSDPSGLDDICGAGSEFVVIVITYKDGRKEYVGACVESDGGAGGGGKAGRGPRYRGPRDSYYRAAFTPPGLFPEGWWWPGALSSAVGSSWDIYALRFDPNKNLKGCPQTTVRLRGLLVRTFVPGAAEILGAGYLDTDLEPAGTFYRKGEKYGNYRGYVSVELVGGGVVTGNITLDLPVLYLGQGIKCSDGSGRFYLGGQVYP